jgi:spore maturation protein CgeB
MNVVFLGLSITSSWGNGHATNYRALLPALVSRGHDVLFLERDVPWYASARDFDEPYVRLYGSLAELDAHRDRVAAADLVVIGSYVPEGTVVAEWAFDVARGAVAFWDIDTPVTVAKLEAGDEAYLSADLVPRFDLYLSFTGGPLLERIEREFGARRALPFYCMADPAAYRPLDEPERWLLGYLGTYSDDRQATVDSFLVDVARRLPSARFVVAGPGYPDSRWPANVDRIDHLAAGDHTRFYARQRFTLNATRAPMIRAGWSPSVRLFEAAACATPVVSDAWDGLDTFFRDGAEIVVARSTEEVVELLRRTDVERSKAVGRAARERVLAEHTPLRRAEALEAHARTALAVRA